MKSYIIRRSLQSVLICLAISIVTFLLLFLATDPALMLLPPEATVEEVAEFKEQMGLNDPIIVQYFRWLSRLILHGDFGNSFVIDKSASALLLERFPATLELAVGGLAVAILISIPLGIIAAIRKHSLMDNFATLLAVLGQAMPLFWLGIMLIIIFGGTFWHPGRRHEPFHNILLVRVVWCDLGGEYRQN